jgi:hypothetical protein
MAENASEDAYRSAVETLRKLKLFRSTLPGEKKHA